MCEQCQAKRTTKYYDNIFENFENNKSFGVLNEVNTLVYIVCFCVFVHLNQTAAKLLTHSVYMHERLRCIFKKISNKEAI